MKPAVRTSVAALTRVAALAAMASLAVCATGAADASQHAQPARLDVGGTQLAGGGIVVNYLSSAARLLPRVPASAYVIADATTGQVLAARDPHGFFPPARSLASGGRRISADLALGSGAAAAAVIVLIGALAYFRRRASLRRRRPG